MGAASQTLGRRTACAEVADTINAAASDSGARGRIAAVGAGLFNDNTAVAGVRTRWTW